MGSLRHPGASKVRRETFSKIDEARKAAERLSRRRLTKAPRPYSAIEAEARAAGIPVDVLAVTANRLGVETVDGLWALPGTNGHVPAPVEPRSAVLADEERAALIKARQSRGRVFAEAPTATQGDRALDHRARPEPDQVTVAIDRRDGEISRRKKLAIKCNVVTKLLYIWIKNATPIRTPQRTVLILLLV